MTEINVLNIRDLNKELHVHYFYDRNNKLQHYEMFKIPLFIEKIFKEGNMYVNYLHMSSEILKSLKIEKTIFLHSYVEIFRRNQKHLGVQNEMDRDPL